MQPDDSGLARTQLADLCAYPCARHILNPARQNRPFEIVRKKVYSAAARPVGKCSPENSNGRTQDFPGRVRRPRLLSPVREYRIPRRIATPLGHP
jgi:hypothetical protein